MNVSRTLSFLGLCVWLGATSVAHAQAASHADHGAHAGHGAQAAASGSATAVLSDGEVRRVDVTTGRITIRHGELKNLDMPPMTMVFQARDKSLLDKLKVGDKIGFVAEKEGSRYLVTRIEMRP